MSDLFDHLVVGVAAFVTVFVATPVVRWIARRTGAVAEPGERHIHTRTTPTIGGIAIFAGIIAALAAGSRLPSFDTLFRTTNEPEAIVLASLVIVVVGMLDDTRGISAPAKVAGQVLASGVLVIFGLSLRFVYLPGSPGTIVSLNNDLAALVTIVAMVAMMNAVNLADGLDGLAAGIVTIAAAALFVYSRSADSLAVSGIASSAEIRPIASSASLVLAAVVGACLAFLIYNFNPASIFMGDTGAMLLGLLLAAGGVSAVSNTVLPSRSDFAALSVPVLVPALVLAVPFVDTMWTILRRLRSGRKVFSPDKRHLHHRLMEIGHSHRRAVLIMYYWSALLAFGAVGVSVLPPPVVAAVVAAGVVVALVTAVVGGVGRALRRRRQPPTTAGGGGPGADGIVYPFTRARPDRTNMASDQHKRASRKV